MKTRLKSVSALSVTITFAIFGFIMGCLGVVLALWLTHGAPGREELTIGGPFPFTIPKGVVLWQLPFMAAAGGIVQAVFYSLIYNGIARVTGGIVIWTQTHDEAGGSSPNVPEWRNLK